VTAQTLSAARRRPRRRSPVSRRHLGFAYLFVGPFSVLFLLIVVAPLGYAIGVSLFRKQIIGGTQFVGLENFGRVFTDPLFYDGLLRVAQYMLMQIPLTIGLALVFALFFDSRRVRGSKVARLLMFVPNAIPAVVATLLWGYLYGDEFGPIAQFAQALGLPAPELLGPDQMLGAIVNIAFWGTLGYTMILFYAALQSIPGELYEAAELDGAGQLRIAWSVKIPSIAPTITLATVLSFIGGFQLFNEPNLLAQISPGVITSSYTPNLYIYNTAFVRQDIGYAAALSFVLGLFIVVLSYVFQRVTTRKGLS
jgi:multiple sugar transport system permease protein